MEKQQSQNTISCQTCGQSVPKTHFDIHSVRCNMKNQSIIMSKNTRLSSSRGLRKPKIFQSKKVQIEKETQQKIPCPLCGYMQTFMQLDTHPEKCPGKQSICQFCGDAYPAELMGDHEDVCEANEDREEQDEEFLDQSQLQNPIDRLMNLVELLHHLRSLMNNMQPEEEGLTEKEVKELTHFKYKPGKEEQLCTICYCKLQKGEQCLQTKCRHFYHTECISKWLQKSSKCPLCKHDQKHSK